MTLPPDIKLIPVTGKFVNQDGSPAQGWVSFSPTRVVTVAGVVVLAQGFIVQLDRNGCFSIMLPATDAENLDQVDWSYRVVEGVRGGRIYNLRVPADTVGELDLTTQAPAIPIRDPQSRLSSIAYSGSADDLLGLAQAVKEIPGWGESADYEMDLPGELGYAITEVEDPDTLKIVKTFVVRWDEQAPGLVLASPTGANPGIPAFRALAPSDIPALPYATEAQGTKADSALQSVDLAPVALSGQYADLAGLPALGSAALVDSSTFATAAQGVLATQAIARTSLGQALGPVPLTAESLIDPKFLPAAALTSDVNSVAGLAGVIGKGALITALGLAQVATTGSYLDLKDLPAPPAAQQNADWAAVSGPSQILNKPLLGTASAKDVEFFIPTSELGVANGVAQLGADSKLLPAQLPASITGQMKSQGPWDASAGTAPSLAPQSGWYWLVVTAGNTDVGGVSDWKVGDWIVYDDTFGWYKCDNTDAVVSVAGLEGAISTASLQTALGLNTAAYQPTSAFATAAQGGKADTAVQPAALDPFAKTADLGSAAFSSSADFATAAQGALADTALQPAAGLATIDAAASSKLAGIQAGAQQNVQADWNATEGDALIQNKPILGTAAAKNIGDFATAAQGAKADSALQDATAFATAAQGAKADKSVQALDHAHSLSWNNALSGCPKYSVDGTDQNYLARVDYVQGTFMSKSGGAFTGNISAPNLSGTNSGDQDLSGLMPKSGGWFTGEVYNDSHWFRSLGNYGWYNQTYAGGWYMTDTTYVRSYNNKAVLASDFVISSDRNLKKNITDMVPRARLRPRVFTLRHSGERKFGFVAQELEKDYPEAVGTLTDESGRHIKQVSYALLTAALAAQLNALEDRVNELSKPWWIRLREKFFGR